MADLFLMTRSRGPAWDWSRRLREQTGWDEHAAFMDALAADGFITLGGPVGEGDGEEYLLVVDAEGEEDVRSRFAEDPWEGEMLTVNSVRPWSTWLRGRLRDGVAGLFLVTESRGPAWDWAKRRREQSGWDEHAAFMDTIVEEGLVVLGGPVGAGDGEKALLVVDAGSEDVIRARLAEDPWAGHTLTVESVKPWSVWLRTGRSARGGGR